MGLVCETGGARRAEGNVEVLVVSLKSHVNFRTRCAFCERKVPL